MRERSRGIRPQVRFVASGEAVHSVHGPIAAVLRSYAPWLGAHPRRVANDLVRAALFDGGVMWCNVVLPGKFQQPRPKVGRNRGRAALGRVVATVDGHAIRKGASYVDTGEFAVAAIPGARVYATATANRQRVRIAVPQPHPIQAGTRAMFAYVPPEQVAMIATRVRRSLVRGLVDRHGHDGVRGLS